MSCPITHVRYSSDSRFVCFLERGASGKSGIVAVEVGSRRRILLVDPEEHVPEGARSHEEELERERQRVLTEGVTSFEWIPGSAALLLPLPTGLYRVDVEARFADERGATRLQLVTPKGDFPALLRPHVSPSGELVAFVANRELWVASMDGSVPPRRVTEGADEERGISNGTPDFLHAEEFDLAEGYWWSPDGQLIAFLSTDESAVPKTSLPRLTAPPLAGAESLEHHRFPFAGTTNPSYRLGVVNISALVSPGEAGGAEDIAASTTWMDLDGLGDGYIPRVQWAPDGSLTAQLLNRPQTRLDLVRFEPSSGRAELLVREEDKVWINVHDCLTFLPLGVDPESIDGAPPPPSSPRRGSSPSFDPAQASSRSPVYFVWASERTSTQHLYLYRFRQSFLFAPSDARGHWLRPPYRALADEADPVALQLRRLTGGMWQVASVAAVTMAEQETGFVFFHGNASSPLEQHLYRCPLWLPRNPERHLVDPEPTPSRAVDRGETAEDMSLWGVGLGVYGVVQVTDAETGLWNDATVAPDGATAVLVSETAVSDPTVRLVELVGYQEGGGEGEVAASTTSPSNFTVREALSLSPPPPSPPSPSPWSPEPSPSSCTVEFFTCLSGDPDRTLFGVIFRPNPDKFGPGPYPTLVKAYGGPGIQLVRQQANRVKLDRSAYMLAEDKGVLVVKVDNRGTAGRGKVFEGALKRSVGTVEVDDQVCALNFLATAGLSDPTRVAVFGWSYGGYLALMCMLRRPRRFHVAVAAAPVVRWELYDTAYTERYLETPESNPEGYTRASALTHVDAMAGQLLVVHGLLDENVLFRHTAELMDRLVASGRDFDSVLLPSMRHGPRRAEEMSFLTNKINAFIEKHLLSRKPLDPAVLESMGGE